MSALLQLLVLLVGAPLMTGLIGRVKARFAGRRGPPLVQPWYDLARLARKGVVLSETSGPLFLLGPVVGVLTPLLAAALLPFGSDRAPVAFAGDFLLFAGLLALGRFFTVLAALDTGSAFEGMGAAREASFSALAEPALLLGLGAGLRLAGQDSLGAMLAGGAALPWSAAGAPMLLVVASLVLVLLAECSRIPFDDPNTHLELTMIHEVMVLDHSGPPFALVLYGASLKLTVLGALVVGLTLPLPASPWLAWPLFVAGLAVVAVLVGVVESTLARVRMTQVPRLLVSACLLSGFGLLLAGG